MEDLTGDALLRALERVARDEQGGLLVQLLRCLRGDHEPVVETTGRPLCVALYGPGAVSYQHARACRHCRLLYWVHKGTEPCKPCHAGGRQQNWPGIGERHEPCGGTGFVEAAPTDRPG